MAFPKLVQIFRNTIHIFARNFQLYRLPYLWNWQYKLGMWEHISGRRRPRVVELAEKYANGGEIVELAAGEGALIFSMNPTSYSSYLGFDISYKAIELARKKLKDFALANCEFRVGDMVGWEGGKENSLVILEECVYYLNFAQQRLVLIRAYESLIDGGVILVTFHSKKKHKKSVVYQVFFLAHPRRINLKPSVFLFRN